MSSNMNRTKNYRDENRCPGKVKSSCSTCDIRRVTLSTKLCLLVLSLCPVNKSVCSAVLYLCSILFTFGGHITFSNIKSIMFSSFVPMFCCVYHWSQIFLNTTRGKRVGLKPNNHYFTCQFRKLVTSLSRPLMKFSPTFRSTYKASPSSERLPPHFPICYNSSVINTNRLISHCLCIWQTYIQ
jgi:hypothetical protein